MPGIDKKKLSERDICTKYITPDIREEVNFTDGPVITRGKHHTRGPQKRADFILEDLGVRDRLLHPCPTDSSFFLTVGSARVRRSNGEICRGLLENPSPCSYVPAKIPNPKSAEFRLRPGNTSN